MRVSRRVGSFSYPPVVGSQPGERVAQACRKILGPLDSLTAPCGYDGLALAVIDAIWSIGVNYSGVENVLRSYRDWVCREHGASAEQRTAGDLLEDYRQVGGPEAFAKDVARNRQRTSTRGGVLKAEAVRDACEAFVGKGVLTTADLRRYANDETVKGAWLAVRGQRSGISWHYVLMNARVDDLKPDRMVCRFVAAALGDTGVSPDTAYGEMREAHRVLREEHPGLSLRALDHAIWQHQSGRRRKPGSPRPDTGPC